MESSSPDGYKRDEATGLWVPDIEKAGLNALKEKEVLDPKKFAKKSCRYCNGSGEMRQVTGKDTFKWVICMCVVKNWPFGREHNEDLVNMDFEIQERKNKGVLK